MQNLDVQIQDKRHRIIALQDWLPFDTYVSMKNEFKQKLMLLACLFLANLVAISV